MRSIHQNDVINILIFIYIIILNRHSMDFTQLSSFSPSQQIHKQKINKQILSTFHDFSHELFHQQYSNILNDLHSINSSRSMNKEPIEDNSQNPQLNPQKLLSTINEEDEPEIDFSPTKIQPLTHRKSNIFNSLLPKNKIKKSSSLSANQITIFYFGQPIFKNIEYSQTSTIKTMIEKAISAYIADKNLEQGHIYSIDPQDYEVRFPRDDEPFQPDLTIDPIQHDRLLSQSFFDSLVLLMKELTISSLRKSHQMARKSIQQIISLESQKKVNIHLFNTLNEEIGDVTVSWYANLEAVFAFVKEKQIQYHKFFITENLKDQFELPEDFEVKNLSSYNLYVRAKRYADESEDIETKPIVVVKSFKKKRLPTMGIPISETQASMYEEFEVIKINSRGVEQPRIIGIDQTKIYNYDPEVRKQKRQVSIFSKIFGNHEDTGTKQPYRLIKSIKYIKESENGFELIYDEKILTYIVRNEEVKERILRKLKFLLSYHGS